MALLQILQAPYQGYLNEFHVRLAVVVIAGHTAETGRARCSCQAPFSFALQPGLVPTEQTH